MRYDFVFPSDLRNARMPYLTRLLREQRAVPFKLNAWPPTVTLPRIKVCSLFKSLQLFKSFNY